MEEVLVNIENTTFRLTLGLFGIVLIYFLLIISAHLITQLIHKLKFREKPLIYDYIYRYILDEITLDDIHYRRYQEEVLIQGFTDIISSITGEREQKLKQAFINLGLISSVEKGLYSMFSSSRTRCCYTLGVIGSPASVPYLRSMLYDPNPGVVFSAIMALGEIRDNSCLGSLVSYFSKCSPGAAWLIAAILPFFGGPSYRHIEPYLKPGQLPSYKQMLLTRVAASLKLPESTEQLQSLYYKSMDIDLRLSCLKAIGKINDLACVKTIIEALSDAQWQIRAVACNLVGEMSIKGAVYRLLPLLEDSNWFVRKNSAAALVRLGDIGIAALLAALETNDRYARDMVVQTLEENAVVENAVEKLSSTNPREYEKALELIKTLIKKGYTEYLNNFMRTSPEIRGLITSREKS
ncbi:MAG: HEAT repeat domain-containing protein [Spirochaetota bacterium]